MCKHIDIKTRRQRETILSNDGKELLTCILELPYIDNNDKINRMWEHAGESCLQFCKSKIAPDCTLEHYYVYKLVCKAQLDGNKIIFRTRATLSDRTLCRILFEEKQEFHIKYEGV